MVEPRLFRESFCTLAESIAWMKPGDRPREITDCSALLRYCYRETLRTQGRVFRTGSGELRYFADTENLMRYNTHRIAGEMRAAQPADLLFYRHATGAHPWHSMIFLGGSRLENDRGPFVVYHTGPEGQDPGEMRRPALRELLQHPEPRWRPVPGNSNFLGVYRWNILRVHA